MGSFTQSGTALEWHGGHETVRIEPWGRNSLRIRGTLWQAIQDDLPGALLDAPSADADIQVAAEARFHSFCLNCHRHPEARFPRHGPVSGCRSCHRTETG